MPSISPYLFAIAGLSASLAGLAGLVAGLRREVGPRGLALYRLREVVEFSFANALLAVATVPLVAVLDGIEPAIRVAAAVTLVYLVANAALLTRRQRRENLPLARLWILSAGPLYVATLVIATAAVVSGAEAAFEALLLALLARPMLAFLLVLMAFEEQERTG